MSRLEEKAGGDAVVSTTRRLELTEGAAFWPGAADSASVEEAEQMARVGSFASPFMLHVLVPLIATFARYPLIELELHGDTALSIC